MAKYLIEFVLIFTILGATNSGVIDKKIHDNFEDSHKKDVARLEEKAGLFEGDIDMDESMKEALMSGKISLRDAIISPIYHWPNAILYYKFHSSISYYTMHQIHLAMDHIETETCVRFEYHDGQPDKNYVIFFKGRGCYSRIGRVPIPGRSQRISIGRGCTRIGTIVHEIMHALGFFHEQSRQDRDKFVKIMWKNIWKRTKLKKVQTKEEHRHNFLKYPRLLGSDLGKPYDYRSVMHYSKYAFSRNRKPTIVPLTKKVRFMGQRYGLSYLDAYQINKLYKCHPLCVDKIHPFICNYYRNRGYCHKTLRGKDVDSLCYRTCNSCGHYRGTFIP